MQKDLYNNLMRIKERPFVLLEAAEKSSEDKKTLLFERFEDIITFCSGENIKEFFKKIEHYLDEGYWIAGYFSYEFGYFLEPELFKDKDSKQPLAWLGVCKKPQEYGVQEPFSKKNPELFYSIKNIKPNITKEEYSLGVKNIKEHLQEGDTYQVNHTFKMKFDFEGDPLGMYLDLRRIQPTPYLSLINTGEENILSFSPELFFKIKEGTIVSRPMKGTMSRANTTDEEERLKKGFKESEKIKAENVMIVDLLRNDIGRISEKVSVTSLFDIEKHSTLYQMTSTIKGKLHNGVSVEDIFAALFPCGSVTGAPKIRTMQIIQGLEKEPRGVYTGAIGYISPKRKACFNVAIRTAVINGNKGEMGVGGGVVYDSNEKEEYQEALLKAKFLTEKFTPFSLIETIKWDKEKGYIFLEEHINRLQNSCKYFSIPLDEEKIKDSLARQEKEFHQDTRVRVLVDREGAIAIDVQPLFSVGRSPKIVISSKRIDRNNIFLYHKTTQRSLYEQELKTARENGFFEVIFMNKREELTEGSFTNIFIEKEGKLITPPVSAGLLEGVYRQYLLSQGLAQEGVVRIKDLCGADKIYVGNSVRGLIEVGVDLRACRERFADVVKARSL